MTSKLSAVCVAGLILAASAAHAQDNAAASPPANVTPESAAPAIPAPAPAGGDQAQTPAASGKVGAPVAGKGQVVFFRRSALQGAAIWFKVRENGAELGKLTPGRYFVVTAEPGIHTYTAATENTDKLRLEIEPGETYYVEGKISMGILIGRANLLPADQAAFEKVSAKLKPAAPPPEIHPSAAPTADAPAPAGSGTPAAD
jgi:hypothetical protein